MCAFNVCHLAKIKCANISYMKISRSTVLVNTACRSVQAFLALELTLLYVDCMLQTTLLQTVLLQAVLLQAVLLQAVLLQAVVSDSTYGEQKVLIHKRLLCKHTWLLFHE